MFSAVLSTPQYGYSGCWNVPTMSTRGSPWKMSSVPFPWWTSKSTTATRDRPCAARACAAPTATLLKRQKPMARLRSAWWPGGRTAQNAVAHSPRMTRSTAITTAPAACFAAFSECGLSAVSGSM